MELVYVKTELADDPDSFELVPAWAVYGTGYVTKYTIEHSTINAMAQFPDFSADGIPILLVNAIDGSRIVLDRQY